MSERVLAIIRIGGKLDVSCAQVLIDAINDAHLFAHLGDTYYEPHTLDDLVAALDPNGYLQLTDDEAPGGEMPGIVSCCRELGLPYRLWCQSSSDFGSEVRMWVPGMERAVVSHGDHNDPDAILVNAEHITAVASTLGAGLLKEAKEALEAILRDVPALPPFEVVSTSLEVTVYEHLRL